MRMVYDSPLFSNRSGDNVKRFPRGSPIRLPDRTWEFLLNR
jgi:hypothetical protein